MSDTRVQKTTRVFIDYVCDNDITRVRYLDNMSTAKARCIIESELHDAFSMSARVETFYYSDMCTAFTLHYNDNIIVNVQCLCNFNADESDCASTRVDVDDAIANALIAECEH